MPAIRKADIVLMTLVRGGLEIIYYIYIYNIDRYYVYIYIQFILCKLTLTNSKVVLRMCFLRCLWCSCSQWEKTATPGESAESLDLDGPGSRSHFRKVRRISIIRIISLSMRDLSDIYLNMKNIYQKKHHLRYLLSLDITIVISSNYQYHHYYIIIVY